MAYKTTADITLQAVEAKQQLNSLFQIPSLLLVSSEVTSLSGVLAINEIRDLTESLTLITSSPASPSDPDTGLNYYILKADNPVDISLTSDINGDIYTGAPGIIHFYVFNQSTATRVKHLKLKAGSAVVKFQLLVGHSTV